MAANTHASGTADATVTFSRPVDYLLVFVSTGTTFTLSLDKGANYITIAAGFHSFKVGATDEVRLTSTGAWQLVGVQA